ncbi:S9 family peptidase [Mycobacterium intermedium]|uniref:S9 family peptidase n=1 Tax=Mycobacterium intermedium TaxID=28445 RepID=A0A1E3SF19_MYCIE|nr:S9 family peptidase [Mycobacterium intermedium]MCV6963927.1 S9 family peptidase [Mycobacterium intermedium]ODR00253.1 peptidase S9 [Mycobacterium intermedium]OPE47554.1 S9 family peptidase [Mycobacterium intermedium]ORA95377.1 S9 family peptidase [Mycobacterium intermedium]
MTAVKLIPLEVLLGHPERVSPQISPDGKRLSYVAPLDGVLNVFVGNIGADDDKPVTHDTERGIQGYFWTHDNRHIMYVRDKDGSENYRAYDVDLETGVERDLTPMDGVQCRVIAHKKRFPNDVLVAINKDNPQLHDVYHLDLTTGELEKVVENPGFVGWVIDDNLAVRGAVSPTPDGGMVIMVRDNESADWRPFLQVPPEDAETTGPVGFTKDGSGLYVQTSMDSNTGRLVKMDIATGAVEVIAEDPTYDITGVIMHPDTLEIQGVIVYGERIEYRIFDDSIRDDVAALQELSPGDLIISDRDDADRTWLVAFDNDAGPVKFYTWDRASQTATFLFDHRPELNDYPLVPMEPFSFTTRDGLTVHGYLSFPAGVERANLPTVLVVHGGPWVRDGWGLDPEAQWLANRGYLCVQVNYRGSSGYGKKFRNAGNREWGAKMHDDLLDAIDHLVQLGYVDRDRVAIYGGSYGGYAALIGATFTPDVFKCAISMVGPSNLNTLIESFPEYWKPMIAMWHKRVGDDPDFLWSRSPLSKVDNIKIPMLVAQGENDPRVKRAESEQIVSAMKERGIDHEYVMYENEGHGFVKPENRLDFYHRADRFLAKHLGGRTE